MVKIRVLAEEGAKLPIYKTDGSAGADVSAFLPSSEAFLEPHMFAVIRTGLRFEIPAGYEIQVRPRSGLAAKNGVTVLNAPGTIDSDYRGELQVILINHSDIPFRISNGDRIAQIVVAPVTAADFCIASNLSETERGDGGFGSTGV